MSRTDHDRIMRRIKACLRLAKSDNENEAAAALRQAQALMKKHGIEMRDAEAPDYDVLDKSADKVSAGGMTQAEMGLYSMVCGFFGCSAWFAGGWPVIVGQAPAPAIADYAAVVLLRQLRSNRKEARNQFERKIGPFGRMRHSAVRDFNLAYTRAWRDAVTQKVKDFAQGVDPNTEKAHLRAMNLNQGREPDESTQTFSTRVPKLNGASCAAYLMGAEDGAKANLSAGVAAGQQQERIGAV